MLHDPPVVDFLSSSQVKGWDTIGHGDQPEARWVLLEKKDGV
jgi:hypothetical protein